MEVKQRLVTALNLFLDPIRERRAKIAGDYDQIQAILADGTRRAQIIARETLRKVRKAMQIEY